MNAQLTYLPYIFTSTYYSVTLTPEDIDTEEHGLTIVVWFFAIIIILCPIIRQYNNTLAFNRLRHYKYNALITTELMARKHWL